MTHKPYDSCQIQPTEGPFLFGLLQSLRIGRFFSLFSYDGFHFDNRFI